MKYKRKKICRKAQSILSFSYQNIITKDEAGQSMCALMNA